MIIGIIGLILLVFGWASETIKLIKEKNSRKLDLKFAVMYVIGALCLTVYSIQIRDILFIILNGIVTVLSLVSLIYIAKK